MGLTSRNVRIAGLGIALAGVVLVVGAVLPAIYPDTLVELVLRPAFRGCHQLADRSPHLEGHAFALCHRCFGIVAGVALGGLLAVLGLKIDPSRRWSWVAAASPIAVHVALRWIVPATDLAWLRVATGLVFGTFAGAAVAVALAHVHPPTPPSGGRVGRNVRGLAPRETSS
ncbi:MAG: DUF2085 domain-containing protein [Deltaproteobacteria bacterium]|nr:DUF2085 domain-containing protein [Deltaproteobacteria bacterium]